MQKMSKIMCALTGVLLLSACNQVNGGEKPMETPEPQTTGVFDMKLVPDDDHPLSIAQSFGAEQVILGEDKIYIAMGGSSSCPPRIENTEMVDTELVISLKEYPVDVMCTADYRPVLYVGEYKPEEQVVETAVIHNGKSKREIKVIKMSALESSV